MENETNLRPPFPKYCFAIRNHKIHCVECDRPECFFAELLEADTSDFHTDQLAKATRSINKILSELQPEDSAKKLAFVQTGMGIMLNWVNPEHDADSLADKFGITSEDSTEEPAITSEDGVEAVAKALKLKNP